MVVNRFFKVQVRLVGRVILESNFNTTKKYEMPNGLHGQSNQNIKFCSRMFVGMCCNIPFDVRKSSLKQQKNIVKSINIMQVLFKCM